MRRMTLALSIAIVACSTAPSSESRPEPAAKAEPARPEPTKPDPTKADPAKPEPTKEAALDPCVQECVDGRQMQAIGIDAIEASCAKECADAPK